MNNIKYTEEVTFKILKGPALNVGLVFQQGQVVRSYVGHPNERELVQAIQADYPKVRSVDRKCAVARRAENLFAAYWQGAPVDLSRIPHKLPSPLPKITQAIYSHLKKVKSGDLITYGELAEEVGLKGGARGVGQVIGRNPLPLIIPCHRVVGLSGPGGFSAPGAIFTKAQILNGEGVSLDYIRPASIFHRSFDLDGATGELLRREPRFKDLIQHHPPFQVTGSKPQAPFMGLAKGVIYQQLATKAAETIYKRVLAAQGLGEELDADWLTGQSLSTLNALGLSGAKASTVKRLAEMQVEGQLPELSTVLRTPDFMLRRQLIKIKGIGPWTVEMYLIFSLGRLNVMSVGDLGLRKGLEKLTGKPVAGATDFLRRTAHWQPYRTLGAWYLWRSLGSS